MIELQRCNDKEQWDDYVLEHGGHPIQLWAWGQVKAEHGWRAERVFGYNEQGDAVANAAYHTHFMGDDDDGDVKAFVNVF